MKKILVIRGGGRPNGNTTSERFSQAAAEIPTASLGFTRQTICRLRMNSGKIFILINKTAVFGGKNIKKEKFV